MNAAIKIAKFSKSRTRDAPSSTYPIRKAVKVSAIKIFKKLINFDSLFTSLSLRKKLILESEIILLNHSCIKRTR